MVLVHFEEDIQKGSYDPLKDKDNDNNQPVKPIGAWVCQDVVFVSDSSAVEKVKNLHHDKGRENESEVA